MLVKKILATALCALLAMALAIPTMAFAANSPAIVTVGPVSATAKTGETVSLTVQYTGEEGCLIVEPWDTPAANFPKGDSPFVTYQIRESWPGAVCGEDGIIPGGLLLTFDLGKKYAGYAVKIYADHETGADEVRNGTVSANGTVSTNVDRLSVFSVELDAPNDDNSKVSDNDGDASKNTSKNASKTSSTSPKKVDKTTTSPNTGTDAAPIALLVSAACLGGAAVCFGRMRKKD
jgi:hypothetical protein